MTNMNLTPIDMYNYRIMWVFVTILMTLITIAAVTSDYASLTILLIIPSLPVILYFIKSLVSGSVWAGSLLATAIIFVESANFRVRDYADKSVDIQVGLKLIGIILMLVLSLPTILNYMRKGFQLAPLLWLIFLLYICVTATYAVSQGLAIVAAISVLASFAYLWHIGEVFGRQQLIRVLTGSCFILCLGSIFAYFLIPSLGRMSDWSEGAFIPTSRLQGLFGTANSAGAAGAFGLLLCLLFVDIRKRSLLFALMVVVFASCMLRSDNRMAIVALAGCFAYISFSKGQRGLKSVALLLFISTGVVVFYAFGDMLLNHMARSGSADEVLSGTGRTRIWAVVLQLSAEHPVFGLGFTSSLQILPKNEMLFAAAAHAHDMYLEVLFSGGLIGLVLLVLSISASAKRAYLNGSHNEIGVIIFFLIYGVTEPIMNGLVGFPTMSFFASGILAFTTSSQRGRHSALSFGYLRSIVNSSTNQYPQRNTERE